MGALFPALSTLSCQAFGAAVLFGHGRDLDIDCLNPPERVRVKAWKYGPFFAEPRIHPFEMDFDSRPTAVTRFAPIDRSYARQWKIGDFDSVRRALPPVLVCEGHDSRWGNRQKEVGPLFSAFLTKFHGGLKEELRGRPEFGVGL
jgi:hypothetical protein